jgi:hypothetical protein
VVADLHDGGERERKVGGGSMGSERLWWLGCFEGKEGGRWWRRQIEGKEGGIWI